MDDIEWPIAFEWLYHLSKQGKGGVGVVLQNNDGIVVSLSLKLDFPYSDNVVEYEDLVINLFSALQIGIRRLRVYGDSKLVVQQVNGEFFLKEGALASYLTVVQKLTKSFSSI